MSRHGCHPISHRPVARAGLEMAVPGPGWGGRALICLAHLFSCGRGGSGMDAWEGHHGARAPYSAPKASGSVKQRGKTPAWCPVRPSCPLRPCGPLLRLQAAPHSARSIAPKPRRPTAKHPLRSRPQPHPPQNREVLALPQAVCQASLRCRHAPRASNLQPHPLISTESGRAHIRIHQTSRRDKKESHGGAATGLQYPPAPTRCQSEISASQAQPHLPCSHPGRQGRSL